MEEIIGIGGIARIAVITGVGGIGLLGGTGRIRPIGEFIGIGRIRKDSRDRRSEVAKLRSYWR